MALAVIVTSFVALALLPVAVVRLFKDRPKDGWRLDDFAPIFLLLIMAAGAIFLLVLLLLGG